jgi:hypothetical protein
MSTGFSHTAAVRALLANAVVSIVAGTPASPS